MSSPRRSSYDVVVVGSRCAGAATAMLLARAGHDVVVVDKVTHPCDALSTHGIARGGVVQLDRWGLLDDVIASGAPPARQVTFAVDGDEMTRPIKDRAGVDMLIAPRRHVLDALLCDAARAAGAQVLDGVAAKNVLRDASGRVTGIAARSRSGDDLELTAPYVVGADGRSSTIAQLVGAGVVEEFSTDATLFYAYVGDVAWRGFEFHIARDAFAGVFPTHDGEACVWLCRPTDALSDVAGAGSLRAQALTAALARVAPGLGSRVASGRIASPVRGTARLPNFVRQPVGPGWALVGDAGYHRDPITGHGITDAFRDAELLATALDRSLRARASETTAMADYRQTRAVALRETFDLTRMLARFPSTTRFVELQIRLSDALEREAQMLASLPAAAGTAAAAA